jgi:hypothetical protein
MKTLTIFARTLIIGGLLSNIGSMAQTVTPPPTTPKSSVAKPASPFAVALAKESLASGGNTSPTQSQIDAAVASIQAQRAKGMGWGQIASSLGLNLGHVVSAYRASERAADAKGDDHKGLKKEDDSDKDGKRLNESQSYAKQASESHSESNKSESHGEGSNSESHSQGGKSAGHGESHK